MIELSAAESPGDRCVHGLREQLVLFVRSRGQRQLGSKGQKCKNRAAEGKPKQTEPSSTGSSQDVPSCQWYLVVVPTGALPEAMMRQGRGKGPRSLHSLH